MATSKPSFKVVLLGEGRVGKTSLLLRYVRGEYNDSRTVTTQAYQLDKEVRVGKDSVMLHIWDTAGQERFHALAPLYYRDAKGALLVYDITDRESFERMQNWLRELKKLVGAEICIVIAGNKIDQRARQQIPESEAKDFAAANNAKHFYTSAKADTGVEEVFAELAKDIFSKNAGGQELLLPSRSSRRLLVVDDTPVEEPAKTTCC